MIPLNAIRKLPKPSVESRPGQQPSVELSSTSAAGRAARAPRCQGQGGPSVTTRPTRWSSSGMNETGATTIKVDVIGIGWGVTGRLEPLRASPR